MISDPSVLNERRDDIEWHGTRGVGRLDWVVVVETVENVMERLLATVCHPIRRPSGELRAGLHGIQ